MAAAIANLAAKKLLAGQMDKYRSKKVAGDDDPYFTLVPDRHGKPKKVKKQIPDYIPKHDAEVLARVKSRAYHLDMSLFNLFGIRFGWSSVIGIIPAIGDVIDIFFASRLVQRCHSVDGGLPANITAMMWLNVAIDFLVGLVPFVGDLMDAAFRCNTKNVALLEKHLKEKYGPQDKIARDRSGLEAFSDDSEPPILSQDPHAQRYGTVAGSGHASQPQSMPVASAPRGGPQEVHIGTCKESGGWFSGWGKAKPKDVESGQITPPDAGRIRI